ncbi:hypothetical protein B9057_06005 [Aestuarium zhoushanense]|nr:hypothetical protein B9057_06005 [Aestuarium zhoushanense]
MLKPVSWLKSFTIIGILTLSLLLNGALLLFEGVYTAAAGALSALSGVRSVIVRQADEIADLNSQLIVERQTRRELRSEISEMTAELATERVATARLRRELASNTADLATSRVIQRELRDQVVSMSEQIAATAIARRQTREMISATVGRVGTRMQRGAGRSIASMPGQALPYVGATIVVAATAVEVADMCATMVDMVELQKLFDPDFVENEDQLTVCGLDVPDRQEIITAIKEAPEEVWNAAVEAFPNREDIQNMEFPDVDWSGMADRAISSSQDMAESAMTSASGKWDDIKTWWNAE